MKEEVLCFRGVHLQDHQFGPIYDATFSLYRQEAVLLTGLFGSGLATLTRLLAGELGPFEGEVWAGGRALRILSNEEARAAGIAVIGLRHLLAENMDVTDNLRMLAGKGRLGVMKPIQHADRLPELMRRMRLDKNTDTKTPFERIKWDILAAYSTGARILAFTDLEMYCNNEEFLELEEILLFLKGQGVSLLLIVINDSLWRYTQVADRCLVMRKGMVSSTLHKETGGLFNEDDIHHVVVGRRFPPRSLQRPAAPCRESRQSSPLTLRLRRTGESISLYQGEAVGLYDNDGRIPATLEEFVAAMGREVELTRQGRPFAVNTPRDLVRQGMAVILNASAEKLIFKNLSPVENVAFFAQRRLGGGLYSPQVARYLFDQVVRRYSLLEHCVALRARRDCFGLSYQELFELMVAKWLAFNPLVVVLFTSLTNEDIKMTERFRDLQQELLQRDKAVLLISSDYDRLERDCTEIYEI